MARLLDVSPATVSRWARQGYLPWVGTVGGHRRYPREAVSRLRERLFRGQAYESSLSRRLEELASQVELVSRGGDSVVEIRCHGRAGQGLITASELLAEAALREGKYFQAFPEFGAERSGAPMEAFVRISAQPIYIHAPVLHPQVVMVFDPTLLVQVPVFSGAEERALAVVNSREAPEGLQRAATVPPGLALVTVDATGIALEVLHRTFPNLPMLGALLRASPIVSPDLMAQVIAQRLGKRLSAPLVEANQAAFWEGYQQAEVSQGLRGNGEGPI